MSEINKQETEIIKACFETLIDDQEYEVAKDHLLVLPFDQLQAYKSKSETGSMTFETFNERGFGYAYFGPFTGFPYVEVHYVPMRGHKIHLKDKLDVYVKVFHKDDILLTNRNPK